MLARRTVGLARGGYTMADRAELPRAQHKREVNVEEIFTHSAGGIIYIQLTNSFVFYPRPFLN